LSLLSRYYTYLSLSSIAVFYYADHVEQMGGCISKEKKPPIKKDGSTNPIIPAPRDLNDVSISLASSAASSADPPSASSSSSSGVDEDPFIADYVLKEWKAADRDNSGRLSFQEIKKLLNHLNIVLKESHLKERFKRVDKDGSGELDFNEFKNFLEELRSRPELKVLFEQHAHGKSYITADEFLLFLRTEQKETGADHAYAAKLITEASHSPSAKKLYFTGFSEYFVSQENSAYNCAHRRQIYQPMNLPLPHYYIASSHNTYLLGDQLKGHSSVEAYINAFKLGCKCVELDCWDGDDGLPIIYHGHTMTSKIKFRDVIQGVKDYGFVASPYPVILSLENHCSVEQQIRMAEIMREVLGDLLPTQFILDQTRPLPSPEKLKNKVLVKGKMLSASSATPTLAEAEKDDDTDDEDEEDEDGDDVPEDDDDDLVGASSKKEKKPKEQPEKKDKQPKATKPPKPKKVTTAKELSDTVHLKSVHFASWQNAKDRNAPWEISSFSELKVKKLIKTDPKSLIEYNAFQTTRTYPKGTRFDSSNYSPVNAWLTGCQVVALNYQTKDIPMRLNLGKFLDNGNSGYVLKPAPLRVFDKPHDIPKKTLKVRLIGGWQLPKESGTPKGEVIDPYVRIKMFGVDEDLKHYRSKVVPNNGFNPMWNETIVFNLSRPDLAQILFDVYDQDKLSKDDFIGWASIPISSLQEGYRSVHLFNPKAEFIPEANLLVHISFEDAH